MELRMATSADAGELCALRMDYLEAVSYTHLDVYKRQTYIRALGWGFW